MSIDTPSYLNIEGLIQAYGEFFANEYVKFAAVVIIISVCTTHVAWMLYRSHVNDKENERRDIENTGGGMYK